MLPWLDRAGVGSQFLQGALANCQVNLFFLRHWESGNWKMALSGEVGFKGK